MTAEKVLSHFVDWSPLHAGSVILNIGAGSGDFAKIIHEHTGATVQCYEPFAVENGLCDGPGITVRQCAVGAYTTTLPMTFYPKHPQATSLVNREAPIDKTDATTRLVPVQSLRGIIGLFQVIDYMNLDVEGEEWNILSRPPQALANVQQLSVQFHTDVIGAEWQDRLDDIISQLAATHEHIASPHSDEWCWIEVWFRRKDG